MRRAACGWYWVLKQTDTCDDLLDLCHRVSLTSSKFRKLCRTNKFWREQALRFFGEDGKEPSPQRPLVGCQLSQTQHIRARRRQWMKCAASSRWLVADSGGMGCLPLCCENVRVQRNPLGRRRPGPDCRGRPRQAAEQVRPDRNWVLGHHLRPRRLAAPSLPASAIAASKSPPYSMCTSLTHQTILVRKRDWAPAG